MNGNQFTLRLTDETEEAIAALAEKYGVATDPDREDFFDDLETPDSEMIIFKAAKRMMRKEGSFKDIVAILKKDLHLHEKDAENMANDIKNNIVFQFAEPVLPETEEEPEAPAAIAPLPRGVRRVEVSDVEENAKRMQEEGMQIREERVPDDEERKVKTVIPQEEKKGPDTYRESIE